MHWERFSAVIHNSVWPSCLGISVLALLSSAVLCLNTGETGPLQWSILPLSACTFLWSIDIVWESEAGELSLQTLDNLNYSLCLLVLSEAMLFLSLFWSFFHFSLSPSIFISHQFPPLGVEPINPMGLPLLNTILLVSSGVTVTWGHHLLMGGSNSASASALGLTAFLGGIFLINQFLEFSLASYSISDATFGSILLTLTGFHGFHVFVGLVLLLISTGRLLNGHFTASNHTSLELSIWYWHFVDCIWLVVYSLIYWWGS